MLDMQVHIFDGTVHMRTFASVHEAWELLVQGREGNFPETLEFIVDYFLCMGYTVRFSRS